MNCRSPNNSFTNLNVDQLVRLLEFYLNNFSLSEQMSLPIQVRTYINDKRDKIKFSNTEDLENLAKLLVPPGRNKTFLLVNHLTELTLILPVARTSVKRVFSAMKLIKTFYEIG